MQWRIPNIQEKTMPKNFSIWIYFFAFVISAILFGFFVLLINGETILSKLILAGLYFIIAPLCFGFSVIGFIYSIYHRQMIKTLFFNRCIKNEQELWQEWARQSVQLLDYSYLTDIDDLASKIMGIEGRPPMNPDKALPISALQDVNSSPFFIAFDKLLSSMKSKINSLSSITVLLNTTQNKNIAINIFLNYCHLNHINIKESDIVFSNNIPSTDIIDDWINTKSNNSVLLINLVFGVNISDTEYCCALLFSNTTKALKYSHLHLFRPFKTKLTNLREDLNYLIQAEQIEKSQVHQIWTTFLPISALNILKDYFFNVNSQIFIDPNRLYQLDLNLGKLNENHVWLALALAADGVNLGQKGQIVAAQDHDEINIIQLYDKITPINENEDNNLFFYPIIFVISVIFCMVSVIALLPADNIEYLNLSLIVTVGTILFTIINTLCLYFKLLSYRDDFDEEWSKELNKINIKRDN